MHALFGLRADPSSQADLLQPKYYSLYPLSQHGDLGQRARVECTRATLAGKLGSGFSIAMYLADLHASRLLQIAHSTVHDTKIIHLVPLN